MTEVEENEPQEPTVTDVPEPDQEPHEPNTEDDEAAEAEDAEPTPEPVPDEADEQEAHGPQQEEWERRFQQAERKFQTYVRAVSNIWEEEATHLMPVTISPSAPPGFVDMRDAGRLPDEIKNMLLDFIGMQREQDYEPDPFAEQCAVCKGKGKTRLPTKVAGKESRTCHTCKGFGFIDKTPGGTNAVTVDATGSSNGHAEEAPLTTGDVDNWGQPKILPDGRENPNWGRTPDYWVQVPPWGDTRNLAVGA